MSKIYNRYRLRSSESESPADHDARHRATLASVTTPGRSLPEERLSSSVLLEVKDLQVHFGPKKQRIRAVDGVDFTIGAGESVGLVGESGCGKSTLGRAVLGLESPSAGRVVYEGKNVAAFEPEELQSYRGKAQMIFQDPFGSLNPRMTVGKSIREVLLVHKKGSRSERRSQAEDLFTAVGLDPAYLGRYPHEFSGGQRQRIGIARALAVQPRLLIADEPVSALDVSVQVQILNLLKDLQQERGLTYLFVAHDLAVVRYLCTRVLVMYLGRIVETAAADSMYREPLHPYTKALLSAVPDVQKGLRERHGEKKRIVLEGDVPSPSKPVSGCAFHTRCPFAQDRCRTEAPALRELRQRHVVACHFAQELAYR